MTTSTPTPIDLARGFSAELRERAAAIEEARRLPRDLSDRFAQAGFYRMCVPSALGGLECPPTTTMETIETLARADGASAWCVFIGATSGSVLSLISEGTGREVFATPTTLLSGVFAPRGSATAVDGGFRISGRWPWGSGTQNADWILAGCRIVRDGAPAIGDGRAAETRLMLVPASAVEFLDTWHVSGLSGTGSTDYEIHDVFVPASRAIAFGSIARSRGRSTRFPSSDCSRSASGRSRSVSRALRSTSSSPSPGRRHRTAADARSPPDPQPRAKSPSPRRRFALPAPSTRSPSRARGRLRPAAGRSI